MKLGVVTPIFKKGEEDKAKPYRGIWLMASGYQLYTKLLRRKLVDYLEENGQLSDTQMGFR